MDLYLTASIVIILRSALMVSLERRGRRYSLLLDIGWKAEANLENSKRTVAGSGGRSSREASPHMSNFQKQTVHSEEVITAV